MHDLRLFSRHFNNYLAEGFIRFETFVRGADVVEVVDAVNDGAERTARKQGHNMRCKEAGGARLFLRRARAQNCARQAQAFPHHLPEVERRAHPGHRADEQQATANGERVEIRRKVACADEIKYEFDARAVCPSARRDGKVLHIIFDYKRLVESVGAGAFEFIGGPARRAETLRPGGMCELDGGEADA